MSALGPGARAEGEPREYANPEALRHYAQARLLEEQGETAEAMSEYSRALVLDARSVAIARRLSELAGRQGDAARSLEFAERALAGEPNDARSLWLKGAAQFNLGRPGDALATLEAATRADSDRIEYLQTLARVAEHLERLDVVLGAYRRAVTVDENDAESWFQLAAAQARLGRFHEADSSLAISVRLDPMRPGAFFLRGWIDESLGRTDQAIELYRQHLRIHGADQVTRRRLIRLLVQAGRHEEAYREARVVSRARPDDPEVLEIEADLALRTGRAGEGRRVLDLMRRHAPDDPAVLERVVSLLARHQREQEAATIAGAWARAHPSELRGAFLEARAQALASRLPLALAAARRAIALSPDSLAPRNLLARIYQNGGRFAEAESVWVESARRFPRSDAPPLGLAYCREQRGDLAGAEQAVRDVLRREPDNPTALNFLGYLFADHSLHLDEAVQLIRRALEQDPENGAFVDSLGWAYFRLGQLDRARRELERAVDLTGGDPVVHEHLGDVYKGLHLMDLARDQYRLSLASDRGNARVRAKLAEAR